MFGGWRKNTGVSSSPPRGTTTNNNNNNNNNNNKESNNNNNNNNSKPLLNSSKLTSSDFENIYIAPREPYQKSDNRGEHYRDAQSYQRDSLQILGSHYNDRKLDAWKKVTVIPRTQAAALSKLKVLIRAGIPDSMRKKVWCAITGTAEIKTENPTFFVETLINVFGEEIPDSISLAPTFGGKIDESSHPITREGFEVTRRILSVFKIKKPNLDYIPCLPDLICILLCFMSEDEAYIAIWKMSKNKDHYWNTSKKQMLLFCHTFMDVTLSTIPKVGKHMQKLKVPAETFEPWFSRLFVGVLPHQAVLRVTDSYLSEGYKILYRVGLAILSIEQQPLLATNSVQAFQEKLNQAAIQILNLDNLMKTAFSFYLARSHFEKLHLKNKFKVEDVIEPAMPIYYRPKIKGGKSKFLLSSQIEMIWSWLPNRFKICDTKIIYSTSVHGYSLKSLYENVGNTHPIVVVIRTLQKEVFGMFISTPLEISETQYTGRRDCVLFCLEPAHLKYPAAKDGPDFFLRCTHSRLEFGGGHGTAITLDDELQGTTEKSDTFHNLPVTHDGRRRFTVAELEVFAFV